MKKESDEILAALGRIEHKLDGHSERLDKIEKDCRKAGAVAGVAAGAVSGGIVSVGLALAKAKLGF